jgi:integrase
MGNLTVVRVKALREPGRYSDGDGLLLVVRESGAKSWLWRGQANGKRRDIGLGTYPDVSLAEARDAAAATRKQLRAGDDPVEAKRVAKKAAATIPTFRAAAEIVHAEREGDWRNHKHKAQWINTLKTYAFPIIGEMPIDKVTSGDVLDVLKPIWQTRPETARRVLQRIAKILDWGFARTYCTGGAPMPAIRAGLSTQTKRAKHFASLPHEQVPALMTRLATSETAGRLALRFLILTAARSGEVRGATWDEISDGIWTVPAERMKARREHVVPLSAAAVAVLETARKLRKGMEGEPVFPGMRDQPLSDMTLTKVLRTAIGGDWTVHGFRSSFRDWAAEETSFPREVAEVALAHTNPDKVEASYRRTNYLEKRRDMMKQWADYVAPNQTTG